MTPSSQNGDGSPTRVKIRCTECPFEQTVDPEDETPAEIVIEHGQETSHTLDVSHDDR